MGTSLCDVTMTLKRQEKLGNIFFLKQDLFFYKKYMFDTFTQKFPRDYTAAYTYSLLSKILNTITLLSIHLIWSHASQVSFDISQQSMQQPKKY